MKLFLDDVREAPDDTWIVARSYDAAVAIVEDTGFPDEVSFDHDLGVGKTGFDFAVFLVERDLDTGDMPKQFRYAVHSANPVGRENIDGYLRSYLRYRAGDRDE